jgi:hypothetical protein
MFAARERWLRSACALILTLAFCAGVQAGQEAEGARKATLTQDVQEVFLRTARIVPRSTKTLSEGVTGSRRATLTDGVVTHDVHIQTVDIAMAFFQPAKGKPEIDFKDTYRYNIAGYKLARLLGLDNVPVSVERTFDGKPAAFTWWVDDVSMDEGKRRKQKSVGPDIERFRQQTQILYIFDELIQNRDRNEGNVLWDTDWKMWMIDHTRAFRTRRELDNPERLLRCDRSLLERLRGLTVESMTEAMGRAATRYEIDAVLARRDLIVELYEARIAERGEDAVLFTLQR